jgi:hypothetical protein
MGPNNPREQTAPIAETRSKGTPWARIALSVAAVAGVGVVMACSSPDSGPSGGIAEQTAQTPVTTSESNTTSPVTPAANEPLIAKGPNDLPMPPLPYMPQAAAGPPELMRQAYVFAAQNPGVLEYVPCYCGCGMDGHTSNVDCFVGSRAPNGAVESWDTHGIT